MLRFWSFTRPTLSEFLYYCYIIEEFNARMPTCVGGNILEMALVTQWETW